MKLRYILVTVFLYYVALVGIMIVVETLYLESTVRGIQETIRTSADMALEHTQHIDDFLAFRQEDAYNLPMNANDAEFESTSVFEAMWGITVDSEEDLDTVYDSLYNNEEFFNVMELSEDIRVPLRYYESDPDLAVYTYPNLVWYSVPRAMTLGTGFLSGTSVSTDLQRLDGTGSPTLVDKFIELYGFTETVREVVTGEDGEAKRYFNTPLNTGITYLNRNLLSALFANNMDLQMRLKYKHSENVSSNIGCSDYNPDNKEYRTNTFVCGLAYNSETYGEDLLDQYNPVSNGRFTYLRYDQIGGSSSEGSLFEGLPAKIEYKVIDMHDPSNDAILRSIWGNKTGERSAGDSKAKYFKKLNEEKFQNFESALNGFYDEYPIMVAKVTFYADVSIPYFTPTFRGLQAQFGGDAGVNFLEIFPLADAEMGALGSRRFEYTRYFAVAP